MAKRILVVDDDADVCALLKSALFLKGHEVITATDGFSASTMAMKYLPDLIILDVMMPKMSGFQVCQSLRRMEQFQATPIIFLTAKDAPGDEEWGRKIGGTHYITKPFELHEITALVEQVLAQVEETSDRPELDHLKRDVHFED
jgi:DNA-binding response OmpR family regulator